jgi:uncharacterized damage-inducible protein DinB
MLQIVRIYVALFFLLPVSAGAQETLAGQNPMDTMLKRYATYNEWANAQMAAWLAQASDDMMEREIESSFPTLRQTVLHIWNAEYLWLQALKGLPTGDVPGKSFEGNSAQLLEAWLKASAEFRAYVQAMSDDELRGSRDTGGKSPLAVADIIQHCMNHSTYHRGQLITMGRQAGLENPPRTDFIYFVRL